MAQPAANGLEMSWFHKRLNETEGTTGTIGDKDCGEDQHAQFEFRATNEEEQRICERAVSLMERMGHHGLRWRIGEVIRDKRLSLDMATTELAKKLDNDKSPQENIKTIEAQERAKCCALELDIASLYDQDLWKIAKALGFENLMELLDEAERTESVSV